MTEGVVVSAAELEPGDFFLTCATARAGECVQASSLGGVAVVLYPPGILEPSAAAGVDLEPRSLHPQVRVRRIA